MKNVLIASTALVGLGFAGTAFADGHAQGLTLSGSADIGFVTVDNGGTTSGSYFVHDFDLSWAANGTTDAGLQFGASGDVDDDAKPTVYIAGSWGRLEFGDADEASDKAAPGIQTAGLEDGNGGSDVAKTSVADYDVTDGALGSDEALYTSPTFGGVTFYLSHQLDGQSDAGNTDTTSIGVSYSNGAFTVGGGFSENDVNDNFVIGMQYDFGTAKVAAQYSNIETAGAARDNEDLDLSITFAAGAGTVGVMASFDLDTAPGVSDNNGYGVWYDLPLGGGATLNVAAGSTDVVIGGNTVSQDEFGVGIAMSF